MKESDLAQHTKGDEHSREWFRYLTILKQYLHNEFMHCDPPQSSGKFLSESL